MLCRVSSIRRSSRSISPRPRPAGSCRPAVRRQAVTPHQADTKVSMMPGSVRAFPAPSGALRPSVAQCAAQELQLALLVAQLLQRRLRLDRRRDGDGHGGAVDLGEPHGCKVHRLSAPATSSARLTGKPTPFLRRLSGAARALRAFRRAARPAGKLTVWAAQKTSLISPSLGRNTRSPGASPAPFPPLGCTHVPRRGIAWKPWGEGAARLGTGTGTGGRLRVVAFPA